MCVCDWLTRLDGVVTGYLHSNRNPIHRCKRLFLNCSLLATCFAYVTEACRSPLFLHPAALGTKVVAHRRLDKSENSRPTYRCFQETWLPSVIYWCELLPCVWWWNIMSETFCVSCEVGRVSQQHFFIMCAMSQLWYSHSQICLPSALETTTHSTSTERFTSLRLAQV